MRLVKLKILALALALVILSAMASGGETSKNSSEADQSRGNADARLAGSWGYFVDKTLPKVFIFNQDGSFLHYSAVHMLAGSTFAMEAVYKGNYGMDGNKVVFENVSIARFDRNNDNENRNRIGDRRHAKDMLKTAIGFEPWTLEPVVFDFLEPGVARIGKSDDKDNVYTVFRADWETYKEWGTTDIPKPESARGAPETTSLGITASDPGPINSGEAKTDPSSGNRTLTADEQKLVGFWADNPEDAISKVVSGGRWIEFKPDGTFSLQYNVWWRNGNMRERAATVWQKGDFKVAGGKIITSNVMESAKERLAGYGGTYSDRPVTRPAWEYEFADSHAGVWPGYDWVVINILEWDPESLHEWYFYVKRDDHPLELPEDTSKESGLSTSHQVSGVGIGASVSGMTPGGTTSSEPGPKNGGQAQTALPSGSIDPKLIGEWVYDDISLHGSERHAYFFYENGRALLLITGGTMYRGEVKYSVSDGKIFFIEYYTIDAIGNKSLRIDKVVEYSIGTDERGEYLTIGNVPGLTEYGENRPNMKFRRM